MSARRVLITGGSGFVGQWLSRHLLGQGVTVFAGTVGESTGPRVLTTEQRESVTWLPMDTTSETDIARAFDRAAPTEVVHLAGMAFAADANAAPARAFEVNALGVLRLAAQMAQSRARVRLLAIGSAEQYGLPPATPITESMPTQPLSVYGASKATQELIALQAARGGMDILCTRSFNHSGFGHGPRYILPSLVERVRALPKSGGTLAMGNTEPVRDYLHVADVAAAYDALLLKGTAGEVYNVSSGSGTKVGDIARRVLMRMGVAAEISVDAALARPTDVPVLVGDNMKLKTATGWSPRFGLDDIIDDLINGSPR